MRHPWKLTLISLSLFSSLSASAAASWGIQGGLDFAKAGPSNSTGLYIGLNASPGIAESWDLYSELNAISIPSSLYYVGILVLPEWKFRVTRNVRFLFGAGPEALLKIEGIGRRNFNFNWDIGVGLDFRASHSLLISTRVRYAIGLGRLNTVGTETLDGLFVGLAFHFMASPLAGNDALPKDAFPLQKKQQIINEPPPNDEL